jgi:hypothetical protein
VLLIVAVALIGGPLAYIVLPERVAAEPGAVRSAVLAISPRAAVAPVVAPPAAFIGGTIEPGDLLTDPVGIVSTGAELVAGGALIGWPVTDHTPSTGFGYRSDPFTHRQRWHDGIDLGQPCGDPAVASLDGKVEYAGWAGGYGNRVILRHADRDGHSFATTYNHLARIEVQVGATVARGAVVGRIGSTGRSTACHMHFEVILDGAYVDPMRFLTGDTSKAALSRRVGSFMPAGLPSPTATASSTPTPSNTRSATRTPTPSATTPTPVPTTPVPTTPVPSTPVPSTPVPSTPVPSTPAPTSPSASASTQSQLAASPTSPQPATPASNAAATPAAAASSQQTPLSSTTDAVSTPG